MKKLQRIALLALAAAFVLATSACTTKIHYVDPKPRVVYVKPKPKSKPAPKPKGPAEFNVVNQYD